MVALMMAGVGGGLILEYYKVSDVNSDLSKHIYLKNSCKTMMPKEFIDIVFLDDLSRSVEEIPYITFAVMTTGIEFLGKCLDSDPEHWNVSGKSRLDFKKQLIDSQV